MDLEGGATVTIELVVGRILRINIKGLGPRTTSTTLTTEEARTLANALLLIVAEADAHQEATR